MAGPYDIPHVSPGDPDPTGWANDVADAVNDLHVRVAASGGISSPASGTRVAFLVSDGAEQIGLQGGWMNMLPVWVPIAFTLSSVAVEVIAPGASPSTVKIGLYSINSVVGGAGTLVHDFGTITSESAGVKTLSGGPWAVTAGLYYIAQLSSSNAASFRAGGNQSGGLAQALPLPTSAALGRRYLADPGGTSLPGTSAASPSPNGSEGVAMLAAMAGVIA